MLATALAAVASNYFFMVPFPPVRADERPDVPVMLFVAKARLSA
jgi:hypothetical protein